MQRWKRRVWYGFGLVQVLVFLLVAVKPAHAYVDPGSGLLFFQVGGSMLAGAMFVLRAKIRKLLGLGNPAESADVAKNDLAVKSSAGEASTGTRA